MDKANYIKKTKGEFVDMPKYLKKILNGTNEKQTCEVLLKWADLLLATKWNKKLLKHAITTKLPLDYIDAMKVEPNG